MKILGQELEFKTSQTLEDFKQVEPTRETAKHRVVISGITIIFKCIERGLHRTVEVWIELGEIRTVFAISQEALSDPWYVDNLDFLVLSELFRENLAELLVKEIK